MSQYPQINKPSRLNLDKARKYLQPNESFYLLNHEVNNPNAGGVATPLPANYPACEMDLPSGENYSPNNYYSPITNENYTWHYNSNGVHFISRIDGSGECQIVYDGRCLALSANPRHQITQFRALLDVDEICNKVPGGKLKRLVWVDGTDTPMGSLDVEASIATNFFTTPFFDICPEPCAYLQMCVPEPQGCLVGEFVPFSNADIGLSNRILDKGFKFAYRHVYYDQRASGLSDYSSIYYLDSRACFDNTEGISRCIKFRVPIGNPMVEKIEFYYSDNGGVSWYLYDTIEKYKQYNSNNQYWYQRSLSEDITGTFSESDCSFDYVFCNDKQRVSIDPKLLIRVINPIPREVQGLFRVDQSIAAYNYVVGTCPVDKVELDKIGLEMNCDDTVSCNSEWAEVTVRAVISNEFPLNIDDAKVGYIYRSGGAVGAKDDLTDMACFGFGTKAYEQSFKGEVRNFLLYIEGTNYTGEMKQWKASPGFSNREEIGILSGVTGNDEIDRIAEDIANGNFYYQEYKLKVPKGMKGFVRLVSHYKTSALGVNQNTSTQVLGMLPSGGLSTFTGTTVPSGFDPNVKEMYFDTCNGDVDNLDAFIIADLIYDDDEYAYSGYITDKNSQPVPGALIYASSEFKSTTDYNGFYFFADNDATESMAIHVEQDCGASFLNIDNFGAGSMVKEMAHVNHEIDSDSYADNFLANVNVLVKDCDDLPVGGVRVAISGGKYKITDINGIAHFKLRNYSTRDRSIVAVVMDKNNCFTLDCFDGCNPCMPSTISTLLSACFISNPTYDISPVTKINTQNLIANKRSLKKGGIYDFAFLVEGDCGKISAAYKLKQFNIPKIQDTNGFSVCRFGYNTNGATFPLWAKRGKFLRSINLNPFTLQWVVDKIDRTIDNKIILTIQSLNDYNTQFNFKTNTIYQFAKGDRVEFIRNGDGLIFNTSTFGLLNYQILSPFNDEVISGVTDDVNYFNQIQIVDDGKLDELKEGAIIEIQPLEVSTTNITYYAICANFQIENGIPLNPIGTFDTFDTYLVNRQVGTFPPQYFEHKSPSDFWGETVVDGLSDFISDIGKAYFLNPYENEKRYERNISVGAENQLNYFGDFVKTLDAVEQGGIIAISVKDNKIGLAICENDNFIFQISDDFLRLGNDGIVRAAPVDSIISNPEAKIRGEYGCAYEDIGGILFGDGFATFPCAKANSYIIHNYSIAQKCGLSVNQESGLTETSCQSFFQKRMRDKANANKNATNFLDHYRYSVGQNTTNSVIYLTLKTLRQPATNNESEVYAQPYDTIMYTPISDAFLGFTSFTPEGYSQLDLHTDDGCAFITYYNSIPYITPVNTNIYNTFFSIPCDWFIGIVINKFPDKKKIGISLEGQSDKMFYAKKVTTDKPTFLSEVVPKKVVQLGNKFNFSLYNDINSRGGLYDGQPSRGYEVSILLVRDNTNGLVYNSINNTKRQEYSEIDKILTKFIIEEQSGFDQNL